MRRKLAVLTTTLALTLGAAAHAADGTGPDNVVQSETTGTNSTDLGQESGQ